MSTTIEQRVVKFEFNNANFEENVKQSIGTLDNLKKSINESTSGDAFEGLSKAAGKLNLSSASEAVQLVTTKFSILENVAIGALKNIGAQIETKLSGALKKLTVGDAISGWERFGQKTQAVATIMAAIGDQDFGDVDKLDYVNATLEKLAWFSDETSYNFTDMTDNIGKFVAAGLDLDKSTTAMMGIATWAAQAGQDATVASRAMYQLSQAMGSGEIKLMDWKSIETANMSTREVKEMLIDYAKMMNEDVVTGEDGKTYVRTYNSKGEAKFDELNAGTFRDTLKEGWLTTDIFSTAMGEYASYAEALNAIIESDANEGLDLYATDLMKKMDKAMKKSKETGKTLDDIMKQDYGIDIRVEDEDGNLVSAMRDVTELGMAAFKSAQKARTFSQAIDSIHDAASTKWGFAFEKIFGDMEEATELWTYLSETLYNWFAEPLNGLNDLLRGWKEAGGRNALFGYINEEGEQVNGAFQNIVEAIDVFREAIGRGVAAVFNPKGLSNEKLGKKLAKLTENFRDFTEKLTISGKTSLKISAAIQTILTPIKALFDLIKNVGGSVISFVGGGLKAFFDAFSYFSMDVDALIPNERKMKAFSNSLKGFGKLRELPKPLKRLESPLKTISKFITNLSKVAGKFFGSLKPSERAIELLTSAFKGLKYIIDFLFAPLRLLNSAMEGLLNPKSKGIESFAKFLSGTLLEAILFIPAKIGDIIAKIGEFITQSELFEDVKDIFKSVWGAIKDFIKGFFGAAWEKVGPWFTSIKEAIKGFFDRFKTDSASPVLKKIHEWLVKIKDWFAKTDFSEAGAKVFEALASAFKAIGNAISWVVEKVKGSETLQKIFGAIATGIRTLFAPVKKWVDANIDFTSFSSFFTSLGKALSSLFKKAGDSKLYQTVATGLKNIWASVKKWATEKLDFTSIGGFFKSLGTALIDLAKNFKDSEIFNKLKTGISNIFKAVKEWASENIDFSSIWGFFKSIGPALKVGMEEIKDSQFFKNLTEKLSTAYEAVKKWMTENLHLGGLFDFFEGLSFDTLGEKISGFATTVWNSVQKVISAIGSFFGFTKKEGGVTRGMPEGIGGLLFGRKKKIKGQAGDVELGEALGLDGPVGELGGYDGRPTSVIAIAQQMFEEATPMLEGLSGVMDTASTAIGKVTSLGDVIKGAFEKFKKFIEWIIDQAGEILPKISGLVLSFGGLNFMVGFKKIADGFSSFGDAAERIAKTAKKFAKAAEMKAIAEIIKSIALLLVAIAGSLYIMSRIKPEEMQQAGDGMFIGALVIAEVIAGMYGLIEVSKGISSLKSAAVLAALPLVIGAISVLLLAIASTMKTMVQVTNGLDDGKSLWTDVILPIVAFVGVIFGGLFALMKASKGDGAKSLKGAKGAIVAIGGAIKIMSMMALSLGEADPEAIKQGTLALAAISAILDVMLLSFSSIMKNATVGKLLVGVLAFAEVVGALYIMTEIIKSLASVISSSERNANAVVAALGILAIAALLMVGLTEAVLIPLANLPVAKVATGAVGVAVIAGAFYVMSMAIVEIVKAASSPEISRAGADGGANPLLLVAGAIAAIVVIALVLKTLSEKANGGEMLKVAGAMAIMAVALAAIAAVVLSLAVFAQNDLGAVTAGVLAFVVVLGALVAAAALVEHLEIGVGFALFAAGVLAFGLAIQAVIKAIDMFVDLIIKIGTAMKENKSVIQDGLNGFAEVIVASVPALTMAIGGLIAALLGAIVQNMDQIIDVIFTFLEKFLEKLVKWAPKILPLLGELLSTILTFLVNFLTNDLLPAIVEVLNSLVDNLLALLLDILNKLAEWIPKVLEVLGNLAKDIIDWIGTLITDIIKLIGEKVKDIIDALHDALVGKDGKGGIIGALADLAKDVIKAVTQLAADIITALGDGLQNIGKAFHDAFVGEDGEGGIIGVLKDIITDVITAVLGLGASIITAIGDGLQNIGKAFHDAFVGEDGEGGIIGVLKDIIVDVINAVLGLGADVITAIGTGLSNIGKAFHDAFVGEDGEGGIIGVLKDIIIDVINAVLGLGADVITAIGTGLSNIGTAFHDAFVGKDGEGGIIGVLKDIIVDVINAVLGLGADIITAIGDGLATIGTAFHDALVGEDGNGGIIGVLTDIVTDVTAAAAGLASAIITGLIDGLTTIVTDLKNALIGENGKGGLIKALKDLVTGITEAASDLAAAIVTGIIDGLDGIAKKVHDSLVGTDGKGGIMKTLADLVGDMGEAAGDLIAALVDGLANGADKVIQAAINIFQGVKDDTGATVREGVFDRIAELADAALAAVVRLLNSMADTIRARGPEITNAAWNLIDAVISAIPIVGEIYQLGKDAVQALIRGLNEEGETMEESLEWGHIDVMKELGLTVEQQGSREAVRKKWSEIGDDLITGICRGIDDHKKEALDAIELVNQGLIDEAKEKLGIQSPSKVFAEIGKNVILGLAGGMTNEENQKKVKAAARTTIKGLKASFNDEENAEMLKTAGGRITTWMASGIRGAKDKIQLAAEFLAGKIPGFINSDTSKEALARGGGNVDKHIAAGMKSQNNKDLLLGAVRVLGGAMSGVFSEHGTAEKFKTSGDNFVNGVKDGIDRSAWIAKRQAQLLARGTKFAFDQELEIKSPSRKMIESGKFFDMGLAQGISENADAPIDSAESMSAILLYAMQNAMAMAQAALEDENYTPVITPVVDLTDVQNGMYAMSNMLGAYDGYSVNAAMNSRYNPYENHDGSVKLDPSVDILNSVGGVTSKLDEMIAKLTQLRVYLDSGALVGGIVDQVDNSLGRRSVYVGRGTM